MPEDINASAAQFQNRPSSIEALRLERTQLTQDELAIRCGIPRSTYQRWIAGKTEAKLSLLQLKALCRELGIERIDELPDDFAPN
ncbi:helix-turn-helix transcriptional regulator [Thermoleptolyngbya sichuanensis XZ-Cy5]|uniref:helix-turn-helix transcriptional regulator n=1 Tax=Thermoleptolyngbya sichuanensis TaxID=2885951 RepID=UPI00240D1A4A|nr:helix-turn-helix transcriptional regulator [Thermoleptolyngbya sichuanensis]MDG2614901.1 helix-turn-helix transcriptional regulator [Thermoleptolyngbya sichuanensis XZ-Cy5]